MAADYERVETTTTVVRLVATAPLDATQDLGQMIAQARNEIAEHRGDGVEVRLGYREVWLEPTDEGVAVCFEKSTRADDRGGEYRR